MRATTTHRAAAPSSLNRRQFLVVGTSTLLLSACQAAPQGAAPLISAPSAVMPPTAAPPVTVAPVAARYTIGDLLGTTPFYVAHRGSGDNWVEHSFDAYSRSIDSGAAAIEVSVSATADGVLVCHHDLTTARMTGVDLTIANVTWHELSQLHTDARDWLGPAAKPQPIPRLTDVLDAFAATHVIFLEDKQGTNTPALLEIMDSYPHSTDHIIWKQWAGATQHTLVVTHGYKTWGYFTPELHTRVDDLAPRFDFLGVSHQATDAQVARLVAFGKPVIVWEVHYRSLRDRMVGLGVGGMMCSNLPYVTGTTAIDDTDSFATGRRAAGDLPWTVDRGASVQPLMGAGVGIASVALNHADVQSYLMGSLCPVDSGSYRITCELRWPESLPTTGQQAGIAFGAVDDRPYRVGMINDVSGYHVVLGPNGSLQLFSQAAGQASATLLTTVLTAPTQAGSWVRLQLDVLAQSIRISRLDGAGWSAVVDDANHRGGYFWLCKDYPHGPAVEFRSITVS